MQVNAQSPNWTKTYGNDLNDVGYAIANTYCGGFIVSGTTTNDGGYKNIILLRLDAAGDTIWTHTYGSTYNDESYCVKQCRDSGFIIAGYKSSGSANTDFYIIKTDANGNQLWERTYGGSLNEGSYNIIQTFDDGYAVCGYTGSIGAGFKDMQLIKYDDDGQFQWQKTYGGSQDELAYALVQTSDSGYFLVGTSKSYSNNNTTDIYLVKTDVDGDTLWTKDLFTEGNNAAYSVTVTNGNYYLLAGKTQNPNETTYQAFALKLNTEG